MIQINVIIHLNTGINILSLILLFGSSLCNWKVFKCIITAKDDKAKVPRMITAIIAAKDDKDCVSVLSSLVKRSRKVGITLGFLHQLNRQFLLCKRRQQM